MGFFVDQRMAWFAALASSYVTFGVAHAFDLAAPLQLGAQVHGQVTTEPFGIPASVVSAGSTHQKWDSLRRSLEDERVQIALCDGAREACVSDPALRFLEIVDLGRSSDGRSRLGHINRAINLAIRATSDMAEFGEVDVWSPPLATFARGAGDCEDYAIAKYVALRVAGLPADDLRIIIMRDALSGEDHAIAAARLEGHWLMLDNRSMTLLQDGYRRNWRPLFVMDERHLARYDDADVEARAGGRDVRPALPASSDVTPVMVDVVN